MIAKQNFRHKTKRTRQYMWYREKEQEVHTVWKQINFKVPQNNLYYGIFKLCMEKLICANIVMSLEMFEVQLNMCLLEYRFFLNLLL